VGATDSNQGTTLLEMLVALALGAIIISGLISFYWSGCNIFGDQMERTELQYSARTSMQQMGDDIRSAQEVEIQEYGAKINIVSTSGETVRYFRQNNQLYREATSSRGTAKVPVAENITYLNFASTYRLITVTIEGNRDRITYRLSTSINPRLISKTGEATALMGWNLMQYPPTAALDMS
jgi:prepilin-type N-terminal cleavage/methylation domain-containing protein